jgi:hypothetical protein
MTRVIKSAATARASSEPPIPPTMTRAVDSSTPLAVASLASSAPTPAGPVAGTAHPLASLLLELQSALLTVGIIKHRNALAVVRRKEN